MQMKLSTGRLRQRLATQLLQSIEELEELHWRIDFAPNSPNDIEERKQGRRTAARAAVRLATITNLKHEI